jgi:hypothetical protein
MMRRLVAAISRYRPRVLTVLLLAAVAAMIVLANSSEDIRPRNVDQAKFRYPPPQSELRFDLHEPIADTSTSYFYLLNVSYGWPLVWRQYGVGVAVGIAVGGPAYSPGRLAGDVAIWIVLLAIPAGACEWLLRRYRPRFRFSLRSMLAVVGLAAALCGWFVAERNRANQQDSLIEAFDEEETRLWVERRGPKWLDLFECDRYRRHVVGAELEVIGEEALLEELAQTPDLQYLSLKAYLLNARRIEALGKLRRLETLRIGVSELTRDSGQRLGDALGGMRRLRTLAIAPPSYGISDDDEGMPRECLAAIGALDRLEHFRLVGRTIARSDFGLLKGMTNLKSLVLRGARNNAGQGESDVPLLSQFPVLPRLEVLELSSLNVGDRDMRYVAALPNLKALSLVSTKVTENGLAELAAVASLEELAIGIVGGTPWAPGLEPVKKFKNLKCLRIEGLGAEGLKSEYLRYELWHLPDDQYNDCVRALAELQKAKPGLVIDGDLKAFTFPAEEVPPNWEAPESSFGAFARQAVQDWKEQQAAPNQNTANPPAPN